MTRRLASAERLVFTRGEGLDARIQQIDMRDFERACQAVGIEDFHWHDLRHTWASWHVQRGTPVMVLKELGGWETVEMVQKYAHLAPSHLAAHAGTVKFWSSTGEQKENLWSARFLQARRCWPKVDLLESIRGRGWE
nr:tyrosine-type recombinase/integrase [Burkholderia vietnamiensis]